ncbi:hypothetical protein WJM97_08845 [Okeanomitos corallinicola TIOX110]|uniref:Uncharacterized protein n=1 Tax=Okeanomitos corallinicola TIOX110 TaxID=3133117 RepID=A0ABZ2UWL1_9CYAN
MTKCATHVVEEIQSELCILHGVGDFKAFCWLWSINIFIFKFLGFSVNIRFFYFIISIMCDDLLDTNYITFEDANSGYESLNMVLLALKNIDDRVDLTWLPN